MTQDNLPQTNSNSVEASNDFKRFMDIREKEIELKTLEISEKSRADDRQLDFSKKSLDAEERDRNSQRNHYTKIFILMRSFYILLILIFLSFLGFCLHKGKEQFAFEIVKYVGIFLAGGASGYGISIKKSESRKSDE